MPSCHIGEQQSNPSATLWCVELQRAIFQFSQVGRQGTAQPALTVYTY